MLCDRAEAGHKSLAKRPGQNTNRHQDTFSLQLAGAVRCQEFHAMLHKESSGQAAASEADGVDSAMVAAHLTARKHTLHSNEISFLAGAETVVISPRLPQNLPTPKSR